MVGIVSKVRNSILEVPFFKVIQNSFFLYPMKNFIHAHREVFKYCLVLGGIISFLSLTKFFFIHKEYIPNQDYLNYISYSFYLIPLLAIFSVEFVIRKEWRNLGIMILTVAIFAIGSSFSPVKLSENGFKNVFLYQWIGAVFSNYLIFLIIRYQLLKSKINPFVLIFGAYILTSIISTLFNITSIYFPSEKGFEYGRSLDLFDLFWPLITWVSIYVLDIFVKSEVKTEFFKLNIHLKANVYKFYMMVLIPIQLLLLGAIYHHILSDQATSIYNTPVNLGLILAFFNSHSLYILAKQQKAS